MSETRSRASLGSALLWCGALPVVFSDFLVAVFGTWSLFALVNVYTHRSFDELFSVLWLPLILAVGVLFLARRDAARVAGEDSDAGTREVTESSTENAGHASRIGDSELLPGLTLALAAAGFLAWTSVGLSFWWPWMAALVHLTIVLRRTNSLTEQPTIAPEPRADRRDLLMLVLCILTAVVVTLGINRPDADDAYYLNVAISALDHADLAVLSFDGMHGEPGVPIQQLVHRPQTYELWIAATARLTGLRSIDLYYIVFPAFFAFSLVLVQWNLLRRLGADSAWLAIVMLLLVLLSWGELHRSVGNFAFVRIFQGKAIMLCVFIPLVVANALRFVRNPSLVTWLLLLLTQSAAVAFTSSALILMPLCMGLAVLAGAVPTRKSLILLSTAAMSAAPLLVTLLMVRFEVSQAGPIAHEGNPVSLTRVFGTGVCAPLAVIMLLSLPWLAHRARLAQSRWLGRYITVLFVFVINPVSAAAAAEWIAILFSWRLFWALPMGALVALAFVLGLQLMVNPRNSQKRVLARVLPLFCSIGLVIFVTMGRWTSSPENQAIVEWAEPKQRIPERYVASRVIELAPEDSLVLAERAISVILTGYHHAPRLVGVHSRYLKNLARHWGKDESRTRYAMLRFAQGDLPRKLWPNVIREIDARGIELVVTGGEAAVGEDLVEFLKAEGFASEKMFGYLIWSRQREAEHEPRAS